MPDDINGTRLPPEHKQQPVFLTVQQAAPLAGMSRPTLAKHLQPEPDAWYQGPSGRRWPLWLRSTLETYRAERQDAGE
jgi:hypothetical protein